MEVGSLDWLHLCLSFSNMVSQPNFYCDELLIIGLGYLFIVDNATYLVSTPSCSCLPVFYYFPLNFYTDYLLTPQ